MEKKRTSVEAVVIGAGPAGLAAAACLARAKIPYEIIEREREAASSWKNHYDRLHLHTSKWYSSLPFSEFPKHFPQFVPKKDFVEYLLDYMNAHGIKPRLGEAALSVQKAGDRWRVETPSSIFDCRFVVVSTGSNAEPFVPEFEGMKDFKGRVLHSSKYRNAKEYAGKKTLVVGIGNSGAEIALDLAEGGAETYLSVRGRAHITPRAIAGIPAQALAVLSLKILPPAVADVIFVRLANLTIGDLSAFGIRRPQKGIVAQAREDNRVAVLDVGTVKKIREGSIQVRPGILRFFTEGVAFSDGSRQELDEVVLATGFRPGLSKFLVGEGLIRPDGFPNPEAQSKNVFFVGFRNNITGVLREISLEAQATADQIASLRNT